jgi:deoxyxylulose-5-phosphate synthase
VTVVGVGGGVTYSQLGGTHHAMEDIAVACAIPNMRVIAPCDPLETAAATRWCAKQEEGPVYLRLGKAGEKSISERAAEPWKFGKVRIIKGGREACVIGYGPILKLAMDATEGQDVAVASVHTLKPLDKEGWGRSASLSDGSRAGGNGSARRARGRRARAGLRDRLAVRHRVDLAEGSVHSPLRHACRFAREAWVTEEAIRKKLNG